ncbi:MAG: sigma 54-interacting transcriptional regulator, partial [Clostridia bacterium]|nr:sigma 54-interacting transcriptional regulator [Clostridia bacterium]
KGFASHYTFQDIVGTSASLKKTMEILRKISKTDKTVLLLGQNGTGKELFAHSIHNLSPRREGPFIPINFAGLPENLAESELFGYEEGSFTGAKKGGKLGFFELANNGTIFLDEIGDASPAIQALLLRVLQERQVMRIGGQQMIPINVRVIAATNKNLQELIEQGKFREDLYFRLAVFPLRIPSLKERKEDIPLLVDFFARKYGGKQLNFSQEVMVKFCDYSWPGNVRELESVIQYLTVVCEDNIVTTKDLPEQFREDGNLVEKISREDSDILSLLEERGDLEDFYFILQALREAQINKETIGRGRIKELLENKGISLSDFKIRHRLNILKNLGLIYSGIRGQGSKINSQGMSVLELLEKERG